MRRRLVTTLLFLLILLPTTIAHADPLIGPCQVFPLDNPWNMDVSNPILFPTDPNSDGYIANITAHGTSTTRNVHPDFGHDFGIPYVTVDNSQPGVPVTFDYDSESDHGLYPIPPDAPIESGGDAHVLVVNTDSCILYELYQANPVGNPATSWTAGSGAIFDLGSNALRPAGWTSADAAGLPIFPGLARCEEIASGGITHALRFTVAHTQAAYVYPARHNTGSDTNPNAPPMGLRFRLKADYDLSQFNAYPQSLAVATALKKYGMMVADNGSNWYITGAPSTCWNDSDLNHLKSIPGTAFEVVGSQPPGTAPTRNYFTVPKPTFTWNRVIGAVSYNVQISKSSTFSGTPIEQQSINVPTTLSYTMTTALTEGVYYWRVQACTAPTTCGAWTSELFIVQV